MKYPILRLTHPKTKQVIYCEWIGSCDAPGRAFRSRDAVEQYLLNQIGSIRQDQFEIMDKQAQWLTQRAYERERDAVQDRLIRLDATGSTYLHRKSSGEEIVKFNRAGEGEKRMTLKDLCDGLIERLASTKPAGVES